MERTAKNGPSFKTSLPKWVGGKYAGGSRPSCSESTETPSPLSYSGADGSERSCIRVNENLCQ